MALCGLRKGHQIRIGASDFLILRRLPDQAWQLQNIATGELRTLAELDLLDRFAAGELTFLPSIDVSAAANALGNKLLRDLSAYPPELVNLARFRIEYLKEIDRRQPIAITQRAIEPLVQSVAERIGERKPPGWRTVCRDYRKWVAAGRDIRAIMLRYSDRRPRLQKRLG